MPSRSASRPAAVRDNERMASVLVVDDEPIVRDVVARYLARDGHTIIQAGDGATARRLLEREQPALVVLDVMLPGLDGLGLRRGRRHRHPDGARAATAGEDRGRPVAAAPPRDGVGLRLPLAAVTGVAIVLGLSTLLVGIAAALLVRLLPTVRLQLAGLT